MMYVPLDLAAALGYCTLRDSLVRLSSHQPAAYRAEVPLAEINLINLIGLPLPARPAAGYND
jgi:hypothetical protein